MSSLPVLDAADELVHSRIMAGPLVPTRAAARRAWVIGGALLLATVVISVANPSLIVGGDIVGKVLFSASLMVFAFGIRGAGSITGRKPLGTTALAMLAIWTLLVSILESVLFSGNYPSDALLVFSYVDSFVQFVVALVAATQIARSGVAPRPWNWAPAWALAAVAASWLLQQIVAVGVMQDASSITLFVVLLDGFVRIGALVFLGVLAIVLANRSNRPQTVSIYPKSD
jgi:hypothetical protein